MPRKAKETEELNDKTTNKTVQIKPSKTASKKSATSRKSKI